MVMLSKNRDAASNPFSVKKGCAIVIVSTCLFVLLKHTIAVPSNDSTIELQHKKYETLTTSSVEPTIVANQSLTAYQGNPIKRTEAVVNKQLVSTIFKGLDQFCELSRDAKPYWTYPHTNFVPEFFEYLWIKYVKPNHGKLTFYLEVGSSKAGSVTRLVH